jgi:hypothetical protein
MRVIKCHYEVHILLLKVFKLHYCFNKNKIVNCIIILGDVAWITRVYT